MTIDEISVAKKALNELTSVYAYRSRNKLPLEALLEIAGNAIHCELVSRDKTDYKYIKDILFESEDANVIHSNGLIFVENSLVNALVLLEFAIEHLDYNDFYKSSNNEETSDIFSKLNDVVTIENIEYNNNGTLKYEICYTKSFEKSMEDSSVMERIAPFYPVNIVVSVALKDVIEGVISKSHVKAGEARYDIHFNDDIRMNDKGFADFEDWLSPEDCVIFENSARELMRQNIESIYGKLASISVHCKNMSYETCGYCERLSENCKNSCNPMLYFMNSDDNDDSISKIIKEDFSHRSWCNKKTVNRNGKDIDYLVKTDDFIIDRSISDSLFNILKSRKYEYLNRAFIRLYTQYMAKKQEPNTVNGWRNSSHTEE